MCFLCVFFCCCFVILGTVIQDEGYESIVERKKKERKINREKETRYRKIEYETEIIQTTTECEPRDTRSL